MSTLFYFVADPPPSKGNAFEEMMKSATRHALPSQKVVYNNKDQLYNDILEVKEVVYNVKM